MEIKSSEFFRNMKSLPPEGSEEFRQLIKWEEEKILGGVNINGVHISGWLYWHLNHWWIRIDDIDQYGNDIRVSQLPELRDNEWIRAEALEKAKVERKGYMEVGGRQGGKSEMEASYFGMNATMFQNSQNLIVCGNDNDLSLLKDKVDFGLKNIWQGLSIPRLDKTWRSNQIRLGYKKPDGEDEIWSYIVIRNAKDGHNTEVAAGTTAKSFIMDEIGKYLFASAFKAGEPAIKGKNGWRTVPILVGTGGAFENGQDAENFFFNPEANNFLSFDAPDGKKTCLFLSGEYRQDCKYKTNLADYLVNVLGRDIKDTSELKKVEIFVSDKDKANILIQKERAAAKLNPDRTIYLKQIMYYPLTVEECFLSASENIFDIDGARRQKSRISIQERTGTPVILYPNDDKVGWEFTDKMPISSFPMKTGEDKDAPIVIYEFPIANPPYGLYVAGIDPYRQGQAAYSNSLGTVAMYKRMHDITGEKYQDMFVGSFAARPDKKEKWEKQAELFIQMYNARALCENDEMSFINHMISVNKAHFLEKQPEWLREIVPNSTVNRDYGIHRSAQKIIDFLHGCWKRYTEEVIYQEKNDQGNIIKEVLGIHRILDPMVLEETIQFNEDGNFDRLIAYELALALVYKMDPIFGKVKEETDPRIKALYKPKEQKQLFTLSKRLFVPKKHKIFV